jgi:hypothetical protein
MITNQPVSLFVFYPAVTPNTFNLTAVLPWLHPD